jgi:hypothetical protein
VNALAAAATGGAAGKVGQVANAVDKIQMAGDILGGAQAAINAGQNGLNFQNGAQMAAGVLASVGAASWISGKLSREASQALRDEAGDIWQAATGRRASWDDLEVHHRIPLEWSHVFPRANPNRLANLVGVSGQTHREISAAWAAWKSALNGRAPTQAEVMKQALRIDEMFAGSWVFPT